jgi:hypothetical protein
MALTSSSNFSKRYKNACGGTGDFLRHGGEWVGQPSTMVVSSGPRSLKAWLHLIKTGAIKVTRLSPTGPAAWPKVWATLLEAELQLRFMPT